MTDTMIPWAFVGADGVGHADGFCDGLIAVGMTYDGPELPDEACSVCATDGFWERKASKVGTLAAIVQERPSFEGNGAGSSGKAQGRTPEHATEAQERYLRSLCEQAGQEFREAWVSTKSGASEHIGRLKELVDMAPTPQDAAATPTQSPNNRYAGTCSRCGGEVPEMAGLRARVNGRWMVDHIGDCPAKVAKVEAPATYEAERGDVHVIDGNFYRISVSHSSGQSYATRWDAPSESWEYEGKRPMRSMSESTRITATQASEFGAAYGRCCYCGRALDTAESITAGYGPVCAAKYSLPWG